MSVLIIIGFVILLVTILLLLNPLLTYTPLNKGNAYKDKVSSYECGFVPVIGQNRAPLTITFYIVGILYLIFDLEIALLIPVIGTIEHLGAYAYVAALIFIIVLTGGFVYEINSGAINWSRL